MGWTRRTFAWRESGDFEPLTSKVVAALAIFVVVVAGPFIAALRPQQASRYALTSALLNDFTVRIDGYAHLLDRDRAVRDGGVYSDKAPGQPFFGVPAMAAGRVLGFDPVTEARERQNLDLWWLTLWSATAFGAALLSLTYVRLRDADERDEVTAPLVLFFGSLLFPFSGLLFGHVMAACLLFAAYVLIARDSNTWKSALAGGLLAGAAVLIEYTAAIGAVVLTGLIAWKAARSIGWWLAGASLPAILLALYNNVAFGGPFNLSYRFSAFAGVTSEPRPLFGMFSAPAIQNLYQLLFDGRGLLVATPVLLCAIWAALRFVRTGSVDAVIALAMVGGFLLIPIFWDNPWGGSSAGPRYLIPALPFLIVPLSWAWQRWPLITRVSGGVSVLTMATFTLTDPMPYLDDPASIAMNLRLIGAGLVADTVWTAAFGSWGWIWHGLTIGLVGAWLFGARKGVSHRLATSGVFHRVRTRAPLASSSPDPTEF